LDEAQWKEWLGAHSQEVLESVGIGEGCVVLDFGCGAGAYAIPAARLVGGTGRVYALDMDRAVLGKLQRKASQEGLQNIQTVLSSNLTTGWEDACIDAVLLHDVLHLVDARVTLFDQVYSVLAPDGLISVYPMHVDDDEVSRQMRESGFSLAAKEYEGNILVFRKTDRGRC
jgi:ubiquinone/menaquinone biosynthesis C-methylase UbiE